MKKVISSIISAAVVMSAAVVYAEPIFSDIGASGKLYNAVKELTGYGIVSGYEDGTFRPDMQVTRAEAAKMIMAFIGKDTEQNSDFDDMQGHWANGYVGAAADTYGFVHGFEDNTFRPDDEVTAAQLVTMLLCVTGYEKTANMTGGYPDGYMNLARDRKLFYQMDEIPNSDKMLTRGEAALIMQKATEMNFMAIAYDTKNDNSTERVLRECDGGIEEIRKYYATGEIKDGYLTVGDTPTGLPPQRQYLDISDDILDKILDNPDKYTIGEKKETKNNSQSVSVPDFVPLNIHAPETDDYAIEKDRLTIGKDSVYGKFILDDSFKDSWVYDLADKEGDVTVGVTLVSKKKVEIDDKTLYIGIHPLFDDSICRNGNTLYFYPKHNVEEGTLIRNTSGWENDMALAVRLANGTMEIYLTDKSGEVKSSVVSSNKGITSKELESGVSLAKVKESNIYLTGEYSQAGKSYKVITYSGKQQGYIFSSYDKVIYRGKIGNQEALLIDKQIYRNSVYMGDMLLFEYAEGTAPAYMWISSNGSSAEFIKVKDCDVRPVKYDSYTDSRIEYTESNPRIMISKDSDTFIIDGQPFEAEKPEQFAAFMNKVFAVK